MFGTVTTTSTHHLQCHMHSSRHAGQSSCHTMLICELITAKQTYPSMLQDNRHMAACRPLSIHPGGTIHAPQGLAIGQLVRLGPLSLAPPEVDTCHQTSQTVTGNIIQWDLQHWPDTLQMRAESLIGASHISDQRSGCWVASICSSLMCTNQERTLGKLPTSRGFAG